MSAVVLRAGSVYFALTFLVGAIVGPFRELVLKPAFGGTAALLIEVPVMLLAMAVVARSSMAWFAVPARPSARLAMGGVALALLLVAEATLVQVVRGLGIGSWLRQFASTQGMISAALYLTFAVCPLAWLAVGKEPGC